MLVVKIREAMEAYRRRTGTRLTYDILAERAGLSRSTIESIATRGGYNPTLDTIGRICVVLECQPGDLLELLPAKPVAEARDADNHR